MNYLSLHASLTPALSCVQQLPSTLFERARSTWAFLTQPEAVETYIWLGRMALALIELIIWSCLWAYAQVAKRFEPKHQFVSAEEILAQNPGAPWPIIDPSPFIDELNERFRKVDEWESTHPPELTDEEIAASFSSWGFDCEGYSELPEDDDQDSSDRYVAQPAQEALSQRIDAVMDRKAAQPQAMAAPVATLRIAPSESHEDGLDREYDLADMTLKQLAPIASALGLPTRKVRKNDLIASILEAEGYKL